MKKFYAFRQLRITLFVLVLLAAGSEAGFAQRVSIFPVYTWGNEPAPPPDIIAPGSDNNIIAVFGAAARTSTNAVVTAVRVTTAGTYTPSDIKPNGFKLWFANNNNFNPTTVQGAEFVAALPAVESGHDLVFSGLSRTLNAADGGHFYITADLAEGATLTRTLSLGAISPENLTLAAGVVIGNPLPATAVQTIGIPLPEISIYASGDRGQKLSPGSAKNVIYNFQVYVTKANDVLKSLTVPVAGNFTAADLATNGFKLWYRNMSDDYEEVYVGAASLSEARTVVFENVNVPITRGMEGYGVYSFYITVDLAPGATPGRTIGIGRFPMQNFTFEHTRNLSGPDLMEEGGLNVIAVPSIAISSLGTAAGVASPGSVNNVLYKLKLVVSNASAALTSVRFTTHGTYQPADIARFKLLAGNEDSFYPGTVVATAGAVASGGQVVFNLADGLLPEHQEVVLYVLADLSAGAVAGRTVQIQPVTPAHITVASGIITGSTSAGGVQTIAIPVVTFAPSGPPAGIISPGSITVLHTSRVDVTAASATFQSASYLLSGTYQPADMGNEEDGMGGAYLVYHKTPDLLNEIEQDEGDYLVLLSYAPAVPNSGGTLTFSRANDDDDFNPTIPLGTGYLTVVVFLQEAAVVGRTIQAASTGTAAFTLVSGAKSGALGVGGLQTIGAAAVTVSAVPTPASNIAVGGNQAVLYKIKLDVNDATAMLRELRFTTGGSYQQTDIDEFVIYRSNDSVFNPDEDYTVGWAEVVPNGGTLVFDRMQHALPKGSSTYLFVVARVGYSAVPGRTIRIEATPATGFRFLAATVTGNFPLPGGGTQTIMFPTVRATVPAATPQILAGGSRNNIIHRFNVAVTGVDAVLYSISLTLQGSYRFTDLEGKGNNLWYNTVDSFAGSRMVAQVGNPESGSNFSAYFNELSIRQGTTGYFFITADIASTAVAGRSIQLKVEELYFTSVTLSFQNSSSSPLHIIGQPAAVPALAVNIPAVPAADLLKGSHDNVIYRFNVRATGTGAVLNHIAFFTDGSYRNSDLAAHGLKLWHNTTDTFAGSTLVHAFASTGSGGAPVSAALANIQIQNGSTGYFFITASLSPDAVNNRTIGINGLANLDFAVGTADLSESRGAIFAIRNAPLNIALVTAKAGTLVYPNPYQQQETLTIETNSSQPKLVTIYSATGNVVSTLEMTQTTHLMLSNLSKGLYLVQVQHLKDNKVEVKKLLVQ